MVVVFVLGSCLSAHLRGEITLLAPARTRRTLEKILMGFESETGNKVKVTYGSGRDTTRLVAQGQPLDVNLS